METRDGTKLKHRVGDQQTGEADRYPTHDQDGPRLDRGSREDKRRGSRVAQIANRREYPAPENEQDSAALRNGRQLPGKACSFRSVAACRLEVGEGAACLQ